MKKTLNLYFFVGMLICFIMMFVSWGLSSRVFEYLINNTRTEQGDSQVEFVISRGFSSCMINGFAIMQLVLPLLAILFSFGFIRLCNGYYTNAKPRIDRYSAFVIKDIMKISLSAAVALYFGFLLFYTFGALSHPVVIDENYSRSFLSDIFGEGFSWKNPLLYFLVEGIYKYAFFPFVYCFFSCSVYIYFRKNYMCIIVPTGYYVALSVLSGTLNESFYDTFAGVLNKALRPSNMLMMGAESGNLPAWYPLISLIPPLIASAVFYVKGIQNEKKFG